VRRKHQLVFQISKQKILPKVTEETPSPTPIWRSLEVNTKTMDGRPTYLENPSKRFVGQFFLSN
jgi:hypothetical protein